MEDRVSISIADGIADVRLVRADKMNALDQAMFEALVTATDRLAKEKSLRVVVLSGEGRAFCAGLDMGRFAAMKEKGGNGIPGGESRDLTKRTHGLANFAQEAMSYGLATRICDDPRAAALEMAREIAGKSPDAIRAAKRMLNKLSVDPGPALLAESVEQQKLIGSPNQLEAVRANIEKRTPRFAEAG